MQIFTTLDTKMPDMPICVFVKTLNDLFVLNKNSKNGDRNFYQGLQYQLIWLL